MDKTYNLKIAGLAEAVSQAKADKAHKCLVQALAKFPELAQIQLVKAADEGYSLVQRKVLSADGSVVHDDHKDWLKEQAELDGNNYAATRRRLKGQGYQLSKCELINIHLVQDTGPEQWAFLQIHCTLRQERRDRPLFPDRSYAADWELKELRDLVREAEDGYEYPEAERRPIGQAHYALEESIDFELFLHELEGQEEAQRKAVEKRQYRVHDMQGASRMMTPDEMDPGWRALPHKGRRFFDDWTESSAGREGHRLNRHWVAKISDHTDETGRWMSFIPSWTAKRAPAKIDARKGSAVELHGKLAAFDAKQGVPFAWFFYMLHGNRVDDTAGQRIAEAIKRRQVVLPDCDAKVLARWEARPYGF